MTPEEQQIVTGAVLVVTLIIFSGSGFIREGARQPVRAPRRWTRRSN